MNESVMLISGVFDFFFCWIFFFFLNFEAVVDEINICTLKKLKHAARQLFCSSCSEITEANGLKCKLGRASVTTVRLL